MQKRILMGLLALLLLVGCAAPAPQPTAQQTETQQVVSTEAPAATVTEAPTEAPKPTAAPTEAPAGEYMLPPEPGMHQLTIYWKAAKIDFDTSDMWIW
ncbi:MAG: hypothetical protein IKI59_03115, partial [Clostridia bacterium]|nr:hypothetical protein [Clostridia bacterium]